jgi:hypothetical protein
MSTKTKQGRPKIDDRARRAWADHRGDVNIPALAKHLGITPKAVYGWDYVPAGRIVPVAAFTGKAAVTLRPDLYPAPADPWSGI